MTKHDIEKVWRIVKKTRSRFLSEQYDPDCQDSRTLLSDTDIQNNIKSLAKELKLNTLYIPNKNVSLKTLETAGEMFTRVAEISGINLFHTFS